LDDKFKSLKSGLQFLDKNFLFSWQRNNRIEEGYRLHVLIDLLSFNFTPSPNLLPIHRLQQLNLTVSQYFKMALRMILGQSLSSGILTPLGL
jgi:hypothetical protein